MSQLKIKTIENIDDQTTVDVEYVVSGTGKSWAYGSSAANLNGSFNIASGTDNGTGDYTYDFTNNMADVNYCPTGMSVSTNNRLCVGTSYTTSSYKILNYTPHTPALSDSPNDSLVSGNLA